MIENATHIRVRQRYGVKKGLSPEHPRAGSIDHVEGILVSYTDCWDQFLMKRPFMMYFQKSSESTPRNVNLTCHSSITLAQTTATMV